MRNSVKEPQLIHPCFQESCHGKYGRIHLPVAPACNIQCAYCDRRYDCANESRPGVTSEVISPEKPWSGPDRWYGKIRLSMWQVLPDRGNRWLMRQLSRRFAY